MEAKFFTQSRFLMTMKKSALFSFSTMFSINTAPPPPPPPQKKKKKKKKETRCVCETLMPLKYPSFEKHDPDI